MLPDIDKLVGLSQLSVMSNIQEEIDTLDRRLITRRKRYSHIYPTIPSEMTYEVLIRENFHTIIRMNKATFEIIYAALRRRNVFPSDSVRTQCGKRFSTKLMFLHSPPCPWKNILAHGIRIRYCNSPLVRAFQNNGHFVRLQRSVPIRRPSRGEDAGADVLLC